MIKTTDAWKLQKLDDSMLEKTDENSMIIAAKQDAQAFTGLYQRYVQRVFGYFYNRTNSVVEAEDLTAKTFLAALEALSKYKHNGYFAAWLFGLARHKVMDHYRETRRIEPIENAKMLFTEFDPLQTLVRTERVAALHALIAKLPENDLELIRLRFIAELSFSEIGLFLNRKENTVKKSLYRLLARLKSQLEVSHE